MMQYQACRRSSHSGPWISMMWVRLWDGGPGFIIKHRSRQPGFSERNGFEWYFPAWPARWRVRFFWRR